MTYRPASLTLVVALVALAGCGVPGQQHPTQLDDNDVHLLAPVTTTTLPQGTPTRPVELCLISGDHLTRNLTELATPLSVTRTLQALVDAPRSALPARTRSAINDPNLVIARATTRGVANIDLKADFTTQIPPADQILAIAQIVCTVTSLPGVGQVHFTRAGKPIEIPRADSSLTRLSVSRADYEPLLPAP
jgi:spore germination protein GerM